MSNKPVRKGPKPGPYRKTKSIHPKDPFFARKIDWTKIPVIGPYLAGRRTV